MRADIVEVVRSFESEGRVLFAQAGAGAVVLVPEDSGCAIVVQERGDALTVRTGLDIEIGLDPEEAEFPALLREVLTALQRGEAAERLSTVYRNRLAPAGYTVEYPGGSMSEHGDRPGRQFTVRLPPWNGE
ncbi:hypothetical protein GCM10009801_17010 [Streptomyces albiaxialis]|uniref:Uncharacterized protein n=1 Tax=Streptomyces albiaxialis TaxID=329523 RepID=A0ABP5HBG9_9ACTN